MLVDVLYFYYCENVLYSSKKIDQTCILKIAFSKHVQMQ